MAGHRSRPTCPAEPNPPIAADTGACVSLRPSDPPQPAAATTTSVVLQAGAHRFELHPGDPAVMGIINTNPGSFSDTRHLATLDDQLVAADAMVAAGAAIIDVGTDSGVTYGTPVELEQQLAAAVPLVESLVDRGIPVSVDTPRREVAEATLAAGACMINDVSGLADPAIAEACARHDSALVILHTRVAHKQEAFLDFDDVLADVEALFLERIEVAVAAGLPRERVVLDPGLGYAKHPSDDLTILRSYPRLAAHGLAVLTGASRKYVTGVITGAEPHERLPETLATVETVRSVPGFVRVHDVAEVSRYLAVRTTVDGRRELPTVDTSMARLKWVTSTGA